MASNIQTDFGFVPLDRLIKIFNSYQRQANKHMEKRSEFLKSEEGKVYNKVRARDYYKKHREEILVKRKLANQKKSDDKKTFQRECVGDNDEGEVCNIEQI